MNIFKGRMNELENILVDNFFSIKSETCFFLSHCHTDHMNGLHQLLSRLEKKVDQFLYCSPVSRLILLNKYKNNFKKEIIALTSATIIQVPESDLCPSYQINVTPVPAGHCPGSVMFLFETVNKTILYTGDFRITKNDIKKFKSLQKCNKEKHIDKLYFDSTFLNKSYWNFPLRTKVVLKVLPILKSWLGKDPSHNILLETSAVYGYEFIMVEVARKLGCKIHVDDSFYDLFWNIPEIGCILTKDCTSTKIHAFYSKHKKCQPCYNQQNLYTIKLSAQWYKSSLKSVKPIWKKMSKQKIAFCYSTHCSYSELVDFLNYLHPQELEACTSTVASSEADKKTLIKEITRSWITKSNENTVEELAKTNENIFLPKKNYKFKIKFPDRSTKLYEDFIEPSQID